MKIITLIENMVLTKDLVAEHGLSFLIDTGSKKILFDTGQSCLYAENASRLGVEIRDIDLLVISHGHYDHTGGLAHFIETNEKASVFLKREAFEPKYRGSHYNGINPAIYSENERFCFIEEVTKVEESVYLFNETLNFFPIDRHTEGFFVKRNGELVPDLFQDELFLALVTNGEITLLSSCSHNGITNMVETARSFLKLPVRRVIGGFHIKNKGDEITRHLVNYFNTVGIDEIHTGHCTGIEKYGALKSACKSGVFYNSTGICITL